MTASAWLIQGVVVEDPQATRWRHPKQVHSSTSKMNHKGSFNCVFKECQFDVEMWRELTGKCPRPIEEVPCSDFGTNKINTKSRNLCASFLTSLHLSYGQIEVSSCGASPEPASKLYTSEFPEPSWPSLKLGTVDIRSILQRGISGTQDLNCTCMHTDHVCTHAGRQVTGRGSPGIWIPKSTSTFLPRKICLLTDSEPGCLPKDFLGVLMLFPNPLS